MKTLTQMTQDEQNVKAKARAYESALAARKKVQARIASLAAQTAARDTSVKTLKRMLKDAASLDEALITQSTAMGVPGGFQASIFLEEIIGKLIGQAERRREENTVALAKVQDELPIMDAKILEFEGSSSVASEA